jgi:hypothetical protein
MQRLPRAASGKEKTIISAAYVGANRIRHPSSIYNGDHRRHRSLAVACYADDGMLGIHGLKTTFLLTGSGQRIDALFVSFKMIGVVPRTLESGA